MLKRVFLASIILRLLVFVDLISQSHGCPVGCYLCTAYGPDQCDPSYCRLGYVFNTSTYLCDVCAANCDYCSINGSGTCDPTACLNTFRFNNITLKCDRCASGCNFCNINGPGKCDGNECQVGFTYNSTLQLCDPCSTFCNICNQNGPRFCDPGGCVDGAAYNSSTRLCAGCASYCLSCDVNGPGLCDQDKCKSYCIYNAATKKCDKCASNCGFCSTNGAGKCDVCSTYYYLNQNLTCDACASSCLSCQVTGGGQCDLNHCFSGFIWNSSNLCAPCANSCSTCHINGAGKCDPLGCTVTNYVYNISTMLCDPKCSSNCATCSLIGPLFCDPGGCITGFMYNSTTKLCISCPSYCLTCDSNGPGKCDPLGCNSGSLYNSNTGLCDACSVGCTSCTTSGAGKCDGTSSCSNGYIYNSASSICDACSANCSNCQTNGKNKCDPTGCMSGFIYNSVIQSCDACAGNCSSCLNNGKGYCDSGSCYSGFAFNSTSKTCYPVCSLNCSKCTTNGPGQCDTKGCNSGYEYVSSTRTCDPICGYDCVKCTITGVSKCDPGSNCGAGAYYNSAITGCSKCPTGCQYCDINSKYCNPNSCYASYYFNTSTQLCNPCGAYCESCATNGAGNCDGYCSAGSTFNISTKVCDLCTSNCITCPMNGAGNCDSTGCNSGFQFNTTTLQCDSICAWGCSNCTINGRGLCDPSGCSPGFLFNIATFLCDSCAGNCSSCTVNGPSRCNSNACLTSFAFNTTTKLCDPICSSSCSNCTINGPGFCDPNQCTTGYWWNSTTNSCFSCNSPCFNCSGPTNSDCLTCQSSYFDQHNSSLNSTKQCLNTCPNGYWPDNSTQNCSNCNSLCLTCTGPTSSNCISCNSGYFLQSSNSTTCASTCPVGFFPNSTTNICDPCSLSCINCTGATNNNCISCSSGWYLQPLNSSNSSYSTTCLQNCTAGFWQDSPSNICSLCHSYCLTCFGSSNSQCNSCNTGYPFDSSTTTCGNSLTNLQNAAQNVENELSQTGKPSDSCTDCSQNGVCVYQLQYLQRKCLCNPGWGGSQCNITSNQLQQINSDYSTLLANISNLITGNGSSTMSSFNTQDIQTITSILQTVSNESYYSLNSSQIQQTVALANELLQNIISSQNYSQMSSTAVQNLANVASDTIQNLYQKDCQLNDPTSQTIYNQTIQTMQDLSFIMAQNLSNSDSSNSSNNSVTSIQTTSFDLLVKQSTLQNLYQNMSSATTNQSQIPAFQLTGQVPQQNAQDVVDAYLTNWKIDPLQCPNTTNATQTTRVSFQVDEEGTLTPYSLPNNTSVEIFYPLNVTSQYVSCMVGCQPQSNASPQYFECVCSNISMLSPQAQFASVFVESNLLKLANLAAVLVFKPWRSASIWVLGFIDVTFVTAMIIMFRKPKSAASLSSSAASLEQRLQRKSTYLLAFMAGHPIATFFFFRDRQLPRKYRMIMLFCRVMTLMSFCYLFAQHSSSSTVITYTVLMALPLVTVAPLLALIKWLLQKKYHAVNKINRGYQEDSQVRKKFQRSNKIRFKVCCFLILLIALGTNFCIYVITANLGDEANQCLFKFFVSFTQDLLIMPCLKLLIQVKLIKYLGNQNKSRGLMAWIAKKTVDPLVVKVIARRRASLARIQNSYPVRIS